MSDARNARTLGLWVSLRGKTHTPRAQVAFFPDFRGTLGGRPWPRVEGERAVTNGPLIVQSAAIDEDDPTRRHSVCATSGSSAISSATSIDAVPARSGHVMV